MSKTKVPDIPDVPINVDPALRKFLDAVRQVVQVREGVRGDVLDSAVTFRDLAEGGVVAVKQIGRVIRVDPTTITDLTQPPVVEDLFAAGALASIILSWQVPVYTNHSHTEIWRAQVNDIEQATQVGMASGGIYVDYVARNTTGFKYYYWARNVSIYGIKGEFNTTPAVGLTSPDPTTIVELLDNQLDESKLTQSLNERINLIDNNGSVTTSVDQRIQSATKIVQDDLDSLSTSVSQSTSILNAKIDIVTNSAEQIQQQLDLFENTVTESNVIINERIDDVSAELATTTEALTNADTAIIQSIDSLEVTVGNNSSSITTLTAGLATTNQSIAALNTTVTARLNQNTASIVALNQSIAEINQTITSTDTRLTASIAANVSSIQELDVALATLETSIASSLSTLNAKVNDNTADIEDLNQAIVTTNQSIATTTSTLNARINQTESAIQNTSNAVANTNKALANTDARLTASIAGNTSSINTLNTTVATLNQGLTSTTTTLNAKIDSNTADIIELDQALATTNQAIVTTANQLNARIDETEADIQTVSSAVATTNQSVANLNTTLTARLNNAGGTGISVEQGFSAQASVNDGLYAQYTVKINNATDKYVTGFGLAQTSVNGQTVGEFNIIADRFSIAPVATNPTANDGSPFYHITVPTLINGVTVPAGTYMKKAFIADATIGTAQIADAAITSAKIANLQASKITFNQATGEVFNAAVITGGTISGTNITGNNITGGEISGSRIRVGGTVQYPNVEISDVTNSLRSYSEEYLDNKPIRYSEVSDGNVINFRLFPAGLGAYAYQPTKALTNIYTGISNNGEVVVLPGFWEEEPKIIVSLSSIQLYESSLNSVDQKVVCAATNVQRLSEDPTNPGYYQYSFIPVITLVASASDGVVPVKGQEVLRNLFGSTGFAPVGVPNLNFTLNSTTFIMPANVSSGTITVSHDIYKNYVDGGSGSETDLNGVKAVTRLYVNNAVVFTSASYNQGYPRDWQRPLNNYKLNFGAVPSGTAYVSTTYSEYKVFNNSSNASRTYNLKSKIYASVDRVAVLTSSASALAQGVISWTAIGR